MSRNGKTYEGQAQYARPDYAHKAAKKLKVSFKEKTFNSMHRLKYDEDKPTASLLMVQDEMHDYFSDRGWTLNHDLISGALENLTREGRLIVYKHMPNPKTKFGKKGKLAMRYSISTAKEKAYIEKFVAGAKSWPSGDFILERIRRLFPEVWEYMLENVDAKSRHHMLGFPKGMIYKREYKKYGIAHLMENYNTDGTRRHHDAD